VKFCDKVKDFLSVWEGGTYGTYRAALKQFRRYYSDASNGGSICDFLREYSDDQGRPPLEREKVGRKRLRGFVDYLKGQGYAPKTVRSYIAAVQSLVKYVFGTQVSTAFIKNIPTPEPESRKHAWESASEVADFLDHFEGQRMRAVAVGLYQTGISIQRFLRIPWGAVRDQYRRREAPICIRGRRIKTDQPFRTFLGRWAVRHLRRYLEEEGRPDDPDDRVFPVAKRTVQAKFKQAGESFLGGFERRNPCRPHSLRSAFSSHLADAGMRGLYIEYFQGHSLTGDVRKAYLRWTDEKWREQYEQYEYALTPKNLWEELGVQPP